MIWKYHLRQMYMIDFGDDDGNVVYWTLKVDFDGVTAAAEY